MGGCLLRVEGEQEGWLVLLRLDKTHSYHLSVGCAGLAAADEHVANHAVIVQRVRPMCEVHEAEFASHKIVYERHRDHVASDDVRNSLLRCEFRQEADVLPDDRVDVFPPVAESIDESGVEQLGERVRHTLGVARPEALDLLG